MQNDQKEPVVPSDPPPAIESNFAFHQRLRQTPQYAEAEREASAVEPSEGRMSTVHDYSPRGVKADPGKAAKKIERLRELLAWFVMRYQIKKEAAIPQAPPAIEAVHGDQSRRDGLRPVSEAIHCERNPMTDPLAAEIAVLVAKMRREIAAFHRQAMSPDISADEAGLVNAAAAVVARYADHLAALLAAHRPAVHSERDRDVLESQIAAARLLIRNGDYADAEAELAKAKAMSLAATPTCSTCARRDPRLKGSR